MSKQIVPYKATTDNPDTSIQTVTKDHLLMKFDEIEKRINSNINDKFETNKQERCLERFKTYSEYWKNTASSII